MQNTVEPDRPQFIWRMCIACWITKTIDTLRICNTYCLFTKKTVTQTPGCYFIYTSSVLLKSEFQVVFSDTSKKHKGLLMCGLCMTCIMCHN